MMEKVSVRSTVRVILRPIMSCLPFIGGVEVPKYFSKGKPLNRKEGFSWDLFLMLLTIPITIMPKVMLLEMPKFLVRGRP